MIDLYYWPPPNGKKVTILLEECGLDSKVVPLDNYVEGGGEFSTGYHRDTFYLWLYPAEVAWPAIARSAFYGDSGSLTAAAALR